MKKESLIYIILLQLLVGCGSESREIAKEMKRCIKKHSDVKKQGDRLKCYDAIALQYEEHLQQRDLITNPAKDTDDYFARCIHSTMHQMVGEIRLGCYEETAIRNGITSEKYYKKALGSRDKAYDNFFYK